MKLISYRVREFRSVWDSGAIEIGDVTCLVGKNESGKTALLKALYRLNPKRKGDNVILLLDEPGLSLHGKAQADLLRYIEQELKPLQLGR